MWLFRCPVHSNSDMLSLITATYTPTIQHAVKFLAMSCNVYLQISHCCIVDLSLVGAVSSQPGWTLRCAPCASNVGGLAHGMMSTGRGNKSDEHYHALPCRIWFALYCKKMPQGENDQTHVPNRGNTVKSSFPMTPKSHNTSDIESQSTSRWT